MKRVVVTGGASGMGRAVVELLQKKGYYVYSLDIDSAPTLDNVYQIYTNVADINSVRAAYDIISSHTDEIEAIVNFAGVIMMDSLVEMREEDFVKIFNVNLFGAFRVNKTFLPLILKNKGKIIITTSELAVTKILPFNAVYSMSKKALDDYAEGLRCELGLLDIPVVTIRPGAVKTDLLNKSTDSMERLVENTELYKDKTSKFREIVNKQQGRAISVNKIARLVYNIITKEKVKPIYNKNHNFKLKLLRLVSDKFKFKYLKKLLNKPPKPVKEKKKKEI